MIVGHRRVSNHMQVERFAARTLSMIAFRIMPIPLGHRQIAVWFLDCCRQDSGNPRMHVGTCGVQVAICKLFSTMLRPLVRWSLQRVFRMLREFECPVPLVRRQLPYVCRESAYAYRICHL